MISGTERTQAALIVTLDNGAEIHLNLNDIDWWVFSGSVLTVRAWDNQPTDTQHVVRVRGEWR